MRTSWLSAGIVLAVIAGGVGVGVLSAADVKTVRVRRPAADVDGEVAISVPDEDSFAAEAAGSCVQFGEPFEPLSASNSFRGNKYRFTTDATVLEMRMELQFQGTETLTWSIFECTRDAQNAECTRRFARSKSATGDGSRTVYSSGSLCDPNIPGDCLLLTLPPAVNGVDKDYLIGVSWTGNAAVVHRRGSTLESRVVGGVALLAPLAQTITVTPFAREYYMQVCFTPFPGACCDASNDTCKEILETDCTATGSYFAGELTTCSPVLCQFGACCRPDANCDPNYSNLACDDEGGTWQGAGVGCASGLCPRITGACCHGNQFNSVCDEMAINECEDPAPNGQGGVYQGDDTTCDFNPCVGACCIPGLGCFDLAASSCSLQGGTFRGAGTTCDDLPPALQCGGACCETFNGQPRCVEVSNRDECSDKPPLIVDATYMGDETICVDNTTSSIVACNAATRGACCLPNGTCDVTDQTDCTGGSFTPGATCSSVSCTTCCLADGSCQETTNATACTGLGGTVEPLGSNTCVPSLCNEPTGACCFTNGSCDPFAVIEADCDAAGGRFFQGPYDCSSGICGSLNMGACCRPNETCEDQVVSSECTAFGAAPDRFYVGKTCNSPGVDCPQRGACCDPNDGFCYHILESQCQAIGGVFKGEQTVCDTTICASACCFDNGVCSVYAGEICADLGGHFTSLDNDACVPGVTCPVGACCLATGCEEVLEAACLSRGGTFSGDGVACADSQECPGACCEPDGTCSEVSADECANQIGGVFRGVDTTCEADTCVGACCLRDGQCDETSVATCDTDAGIFQGVDTQCGIDSCLTGACCLTDGCEKILSQICANEGGTYEGDDVECIDSLNCPGACCAPDGTCSEVSADECANQIGGVFRGVDTTCAADTCEGACCMRDGQCNATSVATCDTDGGLFQGVDSVCDIDACPTGACCLLGGCEKIPGELCSNEGGAYEGDGIECVDSECPGGCCAEDGVCNVASASECDADGGVFTGVDSVCEVNSCDGACCERDGTCSLTSRDQCNTLGQQFEGVVTTCDAGSCVTGACCLATGCEMLLESRCIAESGSYQGDGIACLDSSCDGACCNDSGCQILPELGCHNLTLPSIYRGNGTRCDTDTCSGACCARDGSCSDIDPVICDAQDGVFHGVDSACSDGVCVAGACCLTTGCEKILESACMDEGGNYEGDDLECIDSMCAGACCTGSVCSILSDLDCTLIQGQYIANGTSCDISYCTTIVGGDPPDGGIDARQPTEPNGLSAAKTVVVSFDTPVMGLQPGFFDVEYFGATVPSPTVTQVDPGPTPDSVVLTLSGRLVPFSWTQITFNINASSTCFGFLPGDVDNSFAADVSDIVALQDCLAGTTACTLSQCDMDRSGACTPADLLRLIDLLEGGAVYEVYEGKTITGTCAAPPP